MGAHGARAAIGAPGVTLVRVGVGVVLHLIVPGLHVVSWGAIPMEADWKKTQRTRER